MKQLGMNALTCEISSGEGGSTMNEKWTVENLGDGKYMIRNEDRRCIAVVGFIPKPDIFDGPTLQMFAHSNRMLAVCEKFARIWEQGGDQAHAIQAAILEATVIVGDIENATKGDPAHE